MRRTPSGFDLTSKGMLCIYYPRMHPHICGFAWMEIAHQKYRIAVALVTGKRLVSVSDTPPVPILFPETLNLEIALRGPAWQQV